MFERITNSIEDFLRGYSIQENATEELVARRRYFEREEEKKRLGDRFAGLFNVQIFIDSVNDVQREVERMRHTTFEYYGRRFYCLLHRELWEEALSEMGKTKNAKK